MTILLDENFPLGLVRVLETMAHVEHMPSNAPKRSPIAFIAANSNQATDESHAPEMIDSGLLL